jgi:toxin ParE1/3/4
VAVRPVRLRTLASTDLDRAADYYLNEAGVEVAVRFVDAVESTLRQVGRSPEAGSLRFAYELDIPDLRVRSVSRFPYLVFYAVTESVVDVWRILHSRRDVSSAIADTDS